MHVLSARLRVLVVLCCSVVAATAASSSYALPASRASTYALPYRAAPPVTLAERAKVQQRNLAHVRYVCRHGAGAHRRWACAQRPWLARELGESRRALEALEFARADRDWLVAVEVAARAFPASRSWLLSCSEARSEGGWGRFVWNGGSVVDELERARAVAAGPEGDLPAHGSGAGGWLQFMRGTFYGYVDDAFATARARGLVVPARYRSWFSRVGQAVVGARMFERGERRQWTGSGC